MEKFSIPTSAKVYIDALRSLIRSGANATTSLESSALVDLPLVLAQSDTEVGTARRASILVVLLEKVIAEHLRGNDRSVAQALFAYGEYAGISQGDRYAAVAKLRGKRTWDSYRKEPLDRDLLMVYLILYREGEPLRTESATEEGAGVSSPHTSRPVLDSSDFITNSYESIHNFPTSPGASWQIMQMREITASVDGFHAWRQPSRIWGSKNADKHPSITLFGSGRLSVVYDQPPRLLDGPGRIYVTEVRFPEPLHKGERTRFGLLREWPVSVDAMIQPGRRDEASLIGVVLPIEHAVIGVKFPVDKMPKVVWHFEDLPVWLGSGVATETNSLEVDASGYVAYTWKDLLVGYSYGIAWEW